MKKYTFFSRIKQFYNIYAMECFIVGGRTTFNQIDNIFKDTNVTNDFLNYFYVECPQLPFLGEKDKKVKHYYLKPFWHCVKNVLSLMRILSFKHPLNNIKYLWWTINEIWFVMDDFEWYMNPKPERNGRNLGLIKYFTKKFTKNLANSK